MGIREKLNANRSIAIPAILLAAAAAIIYALSGSAEDSTTGYLGSTSRAWYSVDDGKTLFADDAEKLPPFEKDGKKAYGCMVWSGDGGKTRIVSNLYRFTESGKKRMEESVRPGSQMDPGLVRLEAMEVKLPGAPESDWVKATDPRGAEMQIPNFQTGNAPLLIHPD